MSQNPVAPPDGTGAAYIASVTAALNTAFTQSSGAGAPSELLDYRRWADTATMLLKEYNPATAAWITQGYLAAPFGGHVRGFGNNGQTAVENLSVVSNATTSVLLSADDVLVVDTATPKRAWRTGALALTVNLAVSGLNGLDTGVSATGTMYHLWAIFNPSTSVAAGILSVAYPGSGAVVMPSGYTAKGYIGPIGQALAASNVPDQAQYGDCIIMGTTVDLLIAAGGWFSFALSAALLPPNVRQFGGFLNATSSSGTNFATIILGCDQPRSGSKQTLIQATGSVVAGNVLKVPFSYATRPGLAVQTFTIGTNITWRLFASHYRI